MLRRRPSSPVNIAIASILQESNNFSPVKTSYEDLAPALGREALERHRGKLTEMGGFIAALERAGVSIAPACAAWAITANRVVRADFDRLVSEFWARLKKLKRPSALLFAMHGAQTAEGVDDVEGYLLGKVRQLLGSNIPIVVTLDLHANVTCHMVEMADAICGYHTYPHVDMYETGVKAANLALRIVRRELNPVMGFRKLPLIVPAENMQTTSGPMHRLVESAKKLEGGKHTEAVSVFGVQPWLDVAEMGCSVVVVSGGGRRSADRQARQLAKRFWDARREFDVRLTPVKQALRRALRIEGGPVVLAESSDSTGSGSPGDSTGVLKVLLAERFPQPAAIFLVDAEAVAQAHHAGVGATLTMKIGGKLDRKHSKPVQVTGRVRLLSDGRWTPRARGYNPGIETSMGRAAVLEVGAIRILLAERATMTVDPELFRSHGLDPLYMKVVVVKSPNGFRAAYEPIAKEIFVVDTPGVSSANLRALPYRRVPRPIFPLDSRTRLPNDF